MCTIQAHICHPKSFLILHSYFLYVISGNHNSIGVYFFVSVVEEQNQNILAVQTLTSLLRSYSDETTQDFYLQKDHKN